MTRNRINQAKQQLGNPLLGSTITSKVLTTNKARQTILEGNDNIDRKSTNKITNEHPPIDEKYVVNKVYCDNNLLSSSNKMYILSKNITELRKGDFDKVKTKSLQLNKVQVNEELIIEILKSANEIINTVNFCIQVASGTISEYNQLKQEIDNNRFDLNITIIHLDDMFTTSLKKFREVNLKKS